MLLPEGMGRGCEPDRAAGIYFFQLKRKYFNRYFKLFSGSVVMTIGVIRIML